MYTQTANAVASSAVAASSSFRGQASVGAHGPPVGAAGFDFSFPSQTSLGGSQSRQRCDSQPMSHPRAFSSPDPGLLTQLAALASSSPAEAGLLSQLAMAAAEMGTPVPGFGLDSQYVPSSKNVDDDDGGLLDMTILTQLVASDHLHLNKEDRDQDQGMTEEEDGQEGEKEEEEEEGIADQQGEMLVDDEGQRQWEDEDMWNQESYLPGCSESYDGDEVPQDHASNISGGTPGRQIDPDLRHRSELLSTVFPRGSPCGTTPSSQRPLHGSESPLISSSFIKSGKLSSQRKKKTRAAQMSALRYKPLDLQPSPSGSRPASRQASGGAQSPAPFPLEPEGSSSGLNAAAPATNALQAFGGEQQIRNSPLNLLLEEGTADPEALIHKLEGGPKMRVPQFDGGCDQLEDDNSTNWDALEGEWQRCRRNIDDAPKGAPRLPLLPPSGAALGLRRKTSRSGGPGVRPPPDSTSSYPPPSSSSSGPTSHSASLDPSLLQPFKRPRFQNHEPLHAAPGRGPHGCRSGGDAGTLLIEEEEPVGPVTSVEPNLPGLGSEDPKGPQHRSQSVKEIVSAANEAPEPVLLSCQAVEQSPLPPLKESLSSLAEVWDVITNSSSPGEEGSDADSRGLSSNLAHSSLAIPEDGAQDEHLGITDPRSQPTAPAVPETVPGGAHEAATRSPECDGDPVDVTSQEPPSLMWEVLDSSSEEPHCSPEDSGKGASRLALSSPIILDHNPNTAPSLLQSPRDLPPIPEMGNSLQPRPSSPPHPPQSSPQWGGFLPMGIVSTGRLTSTPAATPDVASIRRLPTFATDPEEGVSFARMPGQFKSTSVAPATTMVPGTAFPPPAGSVVPGTDYPTGFPTWTTGLSTGMAVARDLAAELDQHVRVLPGGDDVGVQGAQPEGPSSQTSVDPTSQVSSTQQGGQADRIGSSSQKRAVSTSQEDRVEQHTSSLLGEDDTHHKMTEGGKMPPLRNLPALPSPRLAGLLAFRPCELPPDPKDAEVSISTEFRLPRVVHQASGATSPKIKYAE